MLNQFIGRVSQVHTNMELIKMMKSYSVRVKNHPNFSLHHLISFDNALSMPASGPSYPV